MLDAKRLLDQFLGGQAGGFGGRSRSGFDPSLGRMAQGMGGGLLGGGGGGLLGGGMGRGMLAAGLASMLLRGGRSRGSFGGGALKLGGMALIGSLAYKAFQNWQAGQQPAQAAAQAAAPVPAPAGTAFNPSGEAEQQTLGRNLLRAMIAAAKADGTLDATEQANIFAEMDKLELSPDDKAFVTDELRAPLDVEAVARSARTPEEAAEIYTASLLAIDVDNAAERGYLAMLAARLNLDDALVAHLHATVEQATEKA